MSSVNILVGLSGVGKSTVLEEATLLAHEDYEVVNYGDKMYEVAADRGLVDNRDEMKTLDVETYKEIQAKAAKQIFDLAEDNNIIVDTHAAIKSPYGYIPGLPKWSIEELNPDKVIMLTADPAKIYERSASDEDRDREHSSVESTREYQRVAREMASAGAVLTGAYLKVIENEEGKAEKAAEELVETLRG